MRNKGYLKILTIQYGGSQRREFLPGDNLEFHDNGLEGSDAKEFKRLIRDLPRIRKAAGDKAYSSRVNCQAVADKGGKPFLCFKANATAKAKGYPAWQISFEAYSNNKDEWMDEYHIGNPSLGKLPVIPSTDRELPNPPVSVYALQ